MKKKPSQMTLLLAMRVSAIIHVTSKFTITSESPREDIIHSSAASIQMRTLDLSGDFWFLHPMSGMRSVVLG